MRRVIVYLPRNAILDLRQITQMDGRPTGEILRALIFEFIEARKAQAKVLASIPHPVKSMRDGR